MCCTMTTGCQATARSESNKIRWWIEHQYTKSLYFCSAYICDHGSLQRIFTNDSTFYVKKRCKRIPELFYNKVGSHSMIAARNLCTTTGCCAKRMSPPPVSLIGKRGIRSDFVNVPYLWIKPLSCGSQHKMGKVSEKRVCKKQRRRLGLKQIIGAVIDHLQREADISTVPWLLKTFQTLHSVSSAAT